MPRCIARFVQYALRRKSRRLWAPVHSRRVEVSLEGKPVSKRRTVRPQIITPVQRHSVDIQRSDNVVEMPTAFGVMNQRDALIGLFSKHLNSSFRGGQGDALVVLDRQKAGPCVEQLHGVSAAVVNLVGKQMTHSISHPHQHAFGCLWI